MTSIPITAAPQQNDNLSHRPDSSSANKAPNTSSLRPNRLALLECSGNNCGTGFKQHDTIYWDPDNCEVLCFGCRSGRAGDNYRTIFLKMGSLEHLRACRICSFAEDFSGLRYDSPRPSAKPLPVSDFYLCHTCLGKSCFNERIKAEVLEKLRVFDVAKRRRGPLKPVQRCWNYVGFNATLSIAWPRNIITS